MIKGRDVVIHQNTEITSPDLCKIGNHVAIDSGFYCTAALSIGDYVHISPHVAVIGGKSASLVIKDFVFISVGCKIVCASEKFYGDGLIGPLIPDKYKDIVINKPVIFENFSGIAASCTVLPGVTLGEGSVVGAGSLVKEDTEPWTIYYGTPAKPYKKRCKEKMLTYAKELGYSYD